MKTYCICVSESPSQIQQYENTLYLYLRILFAVGKLMIRPGIKNSCPVRKTYRNSTELEKQHWLIFLIPFQLGHHSLLTIGSSCLIWRGHVQFVFVFKLQNLNIGLFVGVIRGQLNIRQRTYNCVVYSKFLLPSWTGSGFFFVLFLFLQP